MKSNYFVLIFLFLFAQCQKDDEHDYPDLSNVGNISSIVIGKGAWILTYQDIDSISKDSVVYLDKDWFKGDGIIDADFRLVKLDNSNRNYLHITKFRSNNDNQIHNHYDTIIISPYDNLISLNFYEYSASGFVPVKKGIFIGRYNQDLNRIDGYLRHRVGYKIDHWDPPFPAWHEYRTAIAIVNAYCE